MISKSSVSALLLSVGLIVTGGSPAIADSAVQSLGYYVGVDHVNDADLIYQAGMARLALQGDKAENRRIALFLLDQASKKGSLNASELLSTDLMSDAGYFRQNLGLAELHNNLFLNSGKPKAFFQQYLIETRYGRADSALAISGLEKASDLGFPRAQLVLANRYATLGKKEAACKLYKALGDRGFSVVTDPLIRCLLDSTEPDPVAIQSLLSNPLAELSAGTRVELARYFLGKKEYEDARRVAMGLEEQSIERSAVIGIALANGSLFDEAGSLDYLRAAAKAGSDEAGAALIKVLTQGHGVARNEAEATLVAQAKMPAWARRAAEAAALKASSLDYKRDAERAQKAVAELHAGLRLHSSSSAFALSYLYGRGLGPIAVNPRAAALLQSVAEVWAQGAPIDQRQLQFLSGRYFGGQTLVQEAPATDEVEQIAASHDPASVLAELMAKPVVSSASKAAKHS